MHDVVDKRARRIPSTHRDEGESSTNARRTMSLTNARDASRRRIATKVNR
jgi:hypothetical protein